ncbi:MAG: toxic anion resistance protein [Anaerovoracaceae bacterium]|jgi:uncharacterized protein YaaN involved in tellurite resistance
MDEMKTPQAPELVLDGLEEVKQMDEEQQIQLKQDFETERFTPEEQKQIDEFAGKIDLTNTNLVLGYGAGAQKKMADFSEDALSKVRTKDLGEVGNLMTTLVAELKGFDGEEKKGLLGIFKKGADKAAVLKARYDKAEVNVNKIADALEKHQVVLMKDVAMMDNLYELNKSYFKELSMYIAAGKQKLQQTRDVEMPSLKRKAAETGLPEDAQAANDLASMCDRFEKKIYDLDLTRTISIQMAPQIRLVQGNDTVMSEKIQSTLVNTLPIWKSQMIIALGLAHSQEAAKAQRSVSEATNEMLKRNADNLKMATVETAKESERGIVDMETLQHTNEQLISTIDEVLQIQEEGHQKRMAAEGQLQQMEGELKQKLLDIRK